MKSQNPIQESEERKISNSEAEKSLIFSFITFAVRRVEQSWYLFDLWCMFWLSLLITSLSFTAPNISFYITFHITKTFFHYWYIRLVVRLFLTWCYKFLANWQSNLKWNSIFNLGVLSGTFCYYFVEIHGCWILKEV